MFLLIRHSARAPPPPRRPCTGHRAGRAAARPSASRRGAAGPRNRSFGAFVVVVGRGVVVMGRCAGAGAGRHSPRPGAHRNLGPRRGRMATHRLDARGERSRTLRRLPRDDATAWPRPPSAAVRARRQIKAARRAIDVVAYASRLAAAMIGQKRGEL